MSVPRLSTMPARVVLTQGFLYQYGGSEVMTLELAEHFRSRGAEVTVLTHGFEPDLVEPVVSLGVSVEVFTDAPGPELGPGDLLWIHHSMVPDLDRVDPAARIVFNHLSSFHPLEFPLAPRVERALASTVLFTSEEARQAQLDSGLFTGIDPARFAVLGNPAPDHFLDVAGERPAAPRRGVVVSNHLAPELLDAVAELRREVEIDLVGGQRDKGATPQRVTPELLAGYDFVVTIGKTVQFALAAGLPVFCYDHFGGPGWLRTENVEKARWHNFSGRGFDQRPADRLVAELRDGYPGALADLPAVRASLGAGLTLGNALERVLSDPATAHRPEAEVDPVDLQALRKVTASWGVFARMSSELVAANRWLQKENGDFRETLDVLRPAALREARLQEAYREARHRIAELERQVTELTARLGAEGGH